MHLLQFGMRKNGEDNNMKTMGTASADFSKAITSSEDEFRSNFAKKSWISSTSTSSCRVHNNKVLIYVVALAVLIFAFSSFSNMYGASAMPRCGPPCRGDECPDPTDCLYGIVSNYCGKKVCAKGPGDVCGTGMFKMLGTCGDGLYCNCGRCIGCSLITYECFDKTCA